MPESDIFEACLDTKKYVMLQMEDYQGGGGGGGGRNIEGNLSCFTVVVCCEKRSSSVGVIMHVFV